MNFFVNWALNSLFRSLHGGVLVPVYWDIYPLFWVLRTTFTTDFVSVGYINGNFLFPKVLKSPDKGHVKVPTVITAWFTLLLHLSCHLCSSALYRQYIMIEKIRISFLARTTSLETLLGILFSYFSRLLIISRDKRSRIYSYGSLLVHFFYFSFLSSVFMQTKTFIWSSAS